MEQIFTIPEGFELKQTGENQFSIVPKETTSVNDSDMFGRIEDVQREQMEGAVTRHRNSFFTRKETRDNYDFDDDSFNQSDKDKLWEQQFSNPYDIEGHLDYEVVQRKNNMFHEMYNQGKIKKLNNQEMGLLRFCNGIDVKGFLKEEFVNNPINIKTDDDGNIYAEAPNGTENLGKTNPEAFKRKDDDSSKVIQPDIMNE